MLPVDIPPGTTVESLVTQVLPAVHAERVAEGAPEDPFSIALRIEGRGDWTAHIRGRQMDVAAGEVPRPTLWMHTSEVVVERFLEDALGRKRFLARAAMAAPPPGAVQVMTDPRVLKRIAMVNGRIELAARDDDGTRLAVVLGFGDATRRPIDAERPDAVAEGSLATLERVLGGELSPDEALAGGAVTVRGSRLIAMQLALAVAPFYVRR